MGPLSLHLQIRVASDNHSAADAMVPARRLVAKTGVDIAP